MSRRLHGLCLLCGAPAVDGLHCPAHIWASPRPKGGVSQRTFDRLTPDQVVELGHIFEALRKVKP